VGLRSAFFGWASHSKFVILQFKLSLITCMYSEHEKTNPTEEKNVWPNLRFFQHTAKNTISSKMGNHQQILQNNNVAMYAIVGFYNFANFTLGVKYNP
jgi:hypothetical protein